MKIAIIGCGAVTEKKLSSSTSTD
jgi:hypothetical protein